MRRLKITKRNRFWFFISLVITALGYVFFLEYAMLIGLSCIIFIFVDFLADNTMPKSK